VTQTPEEGVVTERRREGRRSVSWPIRVWLGASVFADARAFDASPAGIRIMVSPRTMDMLRLRQVYRIEVCIESSVLIERVAEVRHRTAHSLGLAFHERCPELFEVGVRTEPQSLSV
jgi:hypothetical protein